MEQSPEDIIPELGIDLFALFFSRQTRFINTLYPGNAGCRII